VYSALKDKIILYIEDDTDVLKNISTLLKNYFATIYSAADAESGFELYLRYSSINLLLVDIELPGINGIEFIKKIRAIDNEIPIVIISAYTKTDYLLESVELNIHKYIVKPFTSKKLYELLKKLNETFQKDTILKLTNDIEINSNNSTVNFQTTSYHLTPKELHFLKLLHAKQFIYYGEIYTIWEKDFPSDDAIRSFIKNIRKKLPKNTLKNKQNLGYYV
jgi:DNA-binding response OmpR family regulator